MYLQPDYSPRIDYNTFIEMILLSLLGIASKLFLRIPTFIWSVTVTPAAIFYFWYEKIYGDATRILISNVIAFAKEIWAIILGGIIYFFDETWLAIKKISHYLLITL